MKDYKRLTKRVNNYCVKVYVDNVDSLGLSGTYDDELDPAIFPVINRLADLEDKIENGTLIELPRKVGTPIFIIESNQHDGYYIELKEFSLFYIGREIFLTKEAAEKRLSELRGDKQ